jgi:hypothetical protein
MNLKLRRVDGIANADGGAEVGEPCGCLFDGA